MRQVLDKQLWDHPECGRREGCCGAPGLAPSMIPRAPLAGIPGVSQPLDTVRDQLGTPREGKSSFRV